MGFLDALLNKGAKVLKEAVSDAIENAASEMLSNDTTTSSVNTNSAMEDMDVIEKLRLILANEFPQYEVIEQVSPTTLGGTGNFLPYDFGVYEYGQPKLFIMVVYNNTCSHRDYRWSKEEAEKAGVTMINFVYAFENREDYIINRLHQYL